MRQARGKLTGIVHVLVQGPRCRGIFREKEDQIRMETIIKEVLNDRQAVLYVSLIEVNHMHLIFEVDSSQELSGIMKRISLRYGTWYRKRHGWTGPVFRDRFRSEPVRDRDQLVMTVRYLTNEWEKNQTGSLSVGKAVRDMFYFSGGYEESLKRVPVPSGVLDEIPDYYGMTKEEIEKIIGSRLGESPRLAFRKMDVEEQRRVIFLFRKEDHIPNRYLAECLGITKQDIRDFLR